MKASLSELAGVGRASYRGNGDIVICSVNTLLDAGEGEIAFFSNERYRSDLSATRASAVILDESSVSVCPVENVIVSENPYLSYALIAQHLSRHEQQEAAGIHDAAVIDETAQIAVTARVEALAVIGENVIIEEGVSIGAGTIIGNNCVIGKDTVLSARVTLYPDTHIGQRCLLHSGAVVGGDGFGFANDHGKWVKIPQTGRVIIGDDVEVGVNTAIDRGAIHDTIIGDGVKLDNLIQIAHNVSLGKNTAIAGATAIAGSTSVGEGCTIGGCSGIAGHLDIADNVHVSAMTIVTKSLSDAGRYTGNFPAMPHNLWAKNMARLKQLDDLNKKIKLLEKKLDMRD